MSNNRNLIPAFLSILSVSILSSCGSTAFTANNNQETEIIKLNKFTPKNKAYVVDLKGANKGIITGASFSISIKGPNEGFKTKTSQNGTVATLAQVKSFKVDLCTNPD